MEKIEIGKRSLTLSQIHRVVYAQENVELCREPEYRQKIEKNVSFLLETVRKPLPIYGTTTGFGASCVRYLSSGHAERLQQKLIEYHRCGTGPHFSPEQTLAIMLSRLVSLSRGRSGVRYLLLETLERMINHRILPLIPSQGSVGASGDLTPLAYVAAAMEGLGEVLHQGEKMDAKEALHRCEISPLVFGPKEALAVINGTSVMSAVLALSCLEIEPLCVASEKMTAMLVQVLNGHPEAFDPRIHDLKPFSGQKKTAQAIFKWLENSRLTSDYRKQAAEHLSGPKDAGKLPFQVQDVYSIRCAPQVIGVVRDVLSIACEWAEKEINSVTDNPLIFEEDQTILLGGNFYGGYIAHAADSLKIALASLSDLADRQLAIVVDDKFSNKLPSNLVWGEEWVNHGFKGMQITASALTAEILKNSAPASVFSRVTESCNQDKVSMGTIAARDVVWSTEMASKVLAILGMALCQAIDIREYQDQLSPQLAEFYQKIRRTSPTLKEDRPMDREIEEVSRNLRKGM